MDVAPPMAMSMSNSLWMPKKKVLFFLARRIFTSATYSNTMTETMTSAPGREQPSACLNINALLEGKLAHAHMIEMGLCHEEAVTLRNRVQQTGIQPNQFTFSSVFLARAALAALEDGKVLHEDMIRCGFQSNVFVASALVDIYVKCGSIKYARKVFDRIFERNVVSWTAMTAGYAQKGHVDEALDWHREGYEAMKLFQKIPEQNVVSWTAMIAGVLPACSNLAALQEGKEVHENIIRNGFQFDTFVENGLVDMYANCGSIEDAQQSTIAAWLSCLAGLGTWTEHEPSSMCPITSDAAVWKSLLGVCKTHTIVEIGERAAEHLFELDPKNAAYYVLLANIYVAGGRRGVKGDRSYPQVEQIYAKSETLHGQMKDAGYVLNTNLVLHDVEEEQKEHALCYHSEKLAIAFGIINTSCVTPTWIVKNL
eukprot:Gb_40986 [translate_table: standard]